MNYTLQPAYFMGDTYNGAMYFYFACYSCVILSKFYVVVTMLATFGSYVKNNKYAFTFLLSFVLLYFLVKV